MIGAAHQIEQLPVAAQHRVVEKPQRRAGCAHRTGRVVLVGLQVQQVRSHRRLVELRRVAARALSELARIPPVLLVRRRGQTAQRQKLIELPQ
jgi:hypothetical protein